MADRHDSTATSETVHAGDVLTLAVLPPFTPADKWTVWIGPAGCDPVHSPDGFVCGEAGSRAAALWVASGALSRALEQLRAADAGPK